MISFIVSIAHTLNPTVPIIISGALTTIVALVLFKRLLPIQKIQVVSLTVIGLCLILFSNESTLSLLTKGITINHAIITLIISISFLGLITKPTDNTEQLPTGTSSLWKTLGGVFAFTAVINLSAMTIFGDRLQRHQKLDKTHLMILTRMFGANALWSPFFISMGAALLFSGGAKLTTLLLAGFSMAMLSLVLTGLHCMMYVNQQHKKFHGYPMQLKNLLLPLALSVMVMIAHWKFGHISILILVSIIVVATVITLLVAQQGMSFINDTKLHIEQNISKSSSEILLFLSAGLLAVGISAFVNSIDFQLPIETFNGFHAAVTLLIMVFVSILGLHPIVSISVVGGLLAPLSPDPELVGMMFIFCWGLSIPLSPFSAISLLVQSRYKASAIEVFQTNLGFTLLILLPVCLTLIIYGNSN